MLARKKQTENVDPNSRIPVQKKGVSEITKGVQPKMKTNVPVTRRAAFGDITNATKDQGFENEKKKTMKLKPVTRGKAVIAPPKVSQPALPRRDLKELTRLSDNLNSSNVSMASELPADSEEGDISLISVEDCVVDVASSKPEPTVEESLPSVDQENYNDVFNMGIYAQYIFDYYKRREKMFPIPAYMSDKKCRITPVMRAILVDWLVEIQENFELNHETLYLAVKLTDMYLSRVTVDKEVLQLIGAASVFIASKFDERCPPLIDDFIYICDSAFDRDQFINMEMEVLRTVDFDLGIPISYRFLRRYAKVSRMSMKTLTLARYILEMSLMEYDLVVAKDSMVAAAALYIAQKMMKEGSWEGDVVKSSGYTVNDIKHFVVVLNDMLRAHPTPQLSTIRSKYSHEIFHGVAKMVPLATSDLL